MTIPEDSESYVLLLTNVKDTKEVSRTDHPFKDTITVQLVLDSEEQQVATYHNIAYSDTVKHMLSVLCLWTEPDKGKFQVTQEALDQVVWRPMTMIAGGEIGKIMIRYTPFNFVTVHLMRRAKHSVYFIGGEIDDNDLVLVRSVGYTEIDWPDSASVGWQNLEREQVMQHFGTIVIEACEAFKLASSRYPVFSAVERLDELVSEVGSRMLNQQLALAAEYARGSSADEDQDFSKLCEYARLQDRNRFL